MSIAIQGFAPLDRVRANYISEDLNIPFLTGEPDVTLDVFIFLDAFSAANYHEICNTFQVNMNESTKIIHITSRDSDFSNGNYFRTGMRMEKGYEYQDIIHLLRDRPELAEHFLTLKKA